MAKLFANSGDPDQTPHAAASDQGLHCLPITHLGVSRLQWVNFFSSKTTGLIETKLHDELLWDVGNESLCLGSWSHDQDGHHVLIWLGSYLKCLQVDGIEVKYEN